MTNKHLILSINEDESMQYRFWIGTAIELLKSLPSFGVNGVRITDVDDSCDYLATVETIIGRLGELVQVLSTDAVAA